MFGFPLDVILVFLAFLVVGGLCAPALVRRWKRNEEQQARRLFKLRREVLEAKFFEMAARTGKPRGLKWTRCEWKDRVTFARETPTGLITAFVAVEIHFEAIAGGDMEDVAAVTDVREASAVFHFQNGVWGTGGKALFNMAPELALERLVGQFTTIGDAE